MEWRGHMPPSSNNFVLHTHPYCAPHPVRATMHIDAHGREARLVLGASLAIGCGTNVQFSVPTIRAPTTPLSIGYIAQWLERLTADQQVPGSNPGVP